MAEHLALWELWARQNAKGSRTSGSRIHDAEEIKYTVLDHEGFLDEEYGFLPEGTFFDGIDENERLNIKRRKKNEKIVDVKTKPTEVVWLKGDLCPSPLGYFKIIFSDDLFLHLVNATNKNTERLITRSGGGIIGLDGWKPTTIEEMKVFFGLLFLMGIVGANRVTDYWLKHYLFNLPFHHFMTQHRFLAILRFLRFSSCDLAMEDDLLCELRPLIDYFNNTMATLYHHTGEVFICQSVRYGFVLCMVRTNHAVAQKLDVFLGTNTDQEPQEWIMEVRPYKMMAIHILHVMLNNACELYNKFGKFKSELYSYQMDVVEHLIPKPAGLPEPFDLEIHLPEPLPRSESGKTMRKRCKYCKVVKKVRSDSIYGCRRCKGFPGFCIGPCFRLYHKYI